MGFSLIACCIISELDVHYAWVVGLATKSSSYDDTTVESSILIVTSNLCVNFPSLFRIPPSHRSILSQPTSRLMVENSHGGNLFNERSSMKSKIQQIWEVSNFERSPQECDGTVRIKG